MRLSSANKDLVEYYQRQREALSQLLSTHLIPLVSKREFQQAAKELGLLHKNTIVFDYDYEFNIFMDHCLFFPSSAKTVMDRAIQKGLFSEDSNEMKLLRSLKQAHYSIFMLETPDDQALHSLTDILSGEAFTIIDTELDQQTELPCFTSHLIPVPDTKFWMTMGSLIPILSKELFQGVVTIINKFRSDIEEGKRLARNRQKLLSKQITRYLLRNNALEMVEFDD